MPLQEGLQPQRRTGGRNDPPRRSRSPRGGGTSNSPARRAAHLRWFPMPSGCFRPPSALQSAAFVAPNQAVEYVQRIRPIADFHQVDGRGYFQPYSKAGETKWQFTVLVGLTGAGVGDGSGKRSGRRVPAADHQPGPLSAPIGQDVVVSLSRSAGHDRRCTAELDLALVVFCGCSPRVAELRGGIRSSRASDAVCALDALHVGPLTFAPKGPTQLRKVSPPQLVRHNFDQACFCARAG